MAQGAQHGGWSGWTRYIWHYWQDFIRDLPRVVLSATHIPEDYAQLGLAQQRLSEAANEASRIPGQITAAAKVRGADIRLAWIQTQLIPLEHDLNQNLQRMANAGPELEQVQAQLDDALAQLAGVPEASWACALVRQARAEISDAQRNLVGQLSAAKPQPIHEDQVRRPEVAVTCGCLLIFLVIILLGLAVVWTEAAHNSALQVLISCGLALLVIVLFFLNLGRLQRDSWTDLRVLILLGASTLIAALCLVCAKSWVVKEVFGWKHGVEFTKTWLLWGALFGVAANLVTMDRIQAWMRTVYGDDYNPPLPLTPSVLARFSTGLVLFGTAAIIVIGSAGTWLEIAREWVPPYATQTPMATLLPSGTATPVAVPTGTATPTPTYTERPTHTPYPSPTQSSPVTATATRKATPTHTPTRLLPPTPTIIATVGPTQLPTDTPVPVATATPLPTATLTSTVPPTPGVTPAATPTQPPAPASPAAPATPPLPPTPIVTATVVPSQFPTDTPVPVATATPPRVSATPGGTSAAEEGTAAPVVAEVAALGALSLPTVGSPPKRKRRT